MRAAIHWPPCPPPPQSQLAVGSAHGGTGRAERDQPRTVPQLSHTMDQAAAERKRTRRQVVCQEGPAGTNISQLKCQGCPSFMWLRHSSAHLKRVLKNIHSKSLFKKTMFYTGITLLQNTHNCPNRGFLNRRAVLIPFLTTPNLVTFTIETYEVST